MTPSPFPIKSTLGRSYRVDLGDTRRTKQALLQLGYFKTPRYGLTQYPDEPLFAAIEAFQQDNGLTRDGIMRPDGETAIHLGRAIADLDQRQRWAPIERDDEVGWPNTPRGRASKILTQPNIFDLIRVVAEGLDNDPKDIEATKRALGWAGYYPSDGSEPDIFAAIRRFQSDHGLEVDGYMHPRGPTAYELNRVIVPKVLTSREQHPEDTSTLSDEQIAMMQRPDRFSPNPGRQSGPLLGPGVGGGGFRPRWPRLGDIPKTPDLSGSGNPPATTPPSDPDDEKPSNKEEILPAEQEIPIFRGRPINEVLKTDPAVFEMVSEELRKAFEAAVESSPGDASTQEGNRRAIQICREEFAQWGSNLTFEHIGGHKNLTDKPGPDGKPMKETYVPHPETKQLGSSNADITFQIVRPHPENEGEMQEFRVLLNTGRTLKDGRTPIASEQRQLERMKSNLEAGETTMKDEVAFLPKLRPGMDEAKWEERVRDGCRDMLNRVFGPPQKHLRNFE